MGSGVNDDEIRGLRRQSDPVGTNFNINNISGVHKIWIYLFSHCENDILDRYWEFIAGLNI